MAKNYSSRITQLEEFKERRKILRQLQQSKEKLLYESPQVIAPFIKEKITKTLIERDYESNVNEEPNVLKNPEYSKREKRSADQNSRQYLELMKEQQTLIETQLKLMRSEENKSRKDLEKRVKQFIREKEDKNLKRLKEVQKSLTSLKSYMKEGDAKTNSESSILQELKNLRNDYVKGGGKDKNLLQEMNQLIREVEMSENYNMTGWTVPQQNIQLADQRVMELEEVKRNIKELEDQLDRRNVQKPVTEKEPNYVKRKPVKDTADVDVYHQNDLDYLHKQIYDLQKEIQGLRDNMNKPVKEVLRLSPTPRLDAVNMMPNKVEKRNVVIQLDYATGIGRQVREVIVYMTTYNDDEHIFEKMETDRIHVPPVKDQHLCSSFVINLRQSLFECPILPSVYVIVEIKARTPRSSSNLSSAGTNKSTSTEFYSEAWTKIPIYSENSQTNNIRMGKFRHPLYESPVQNQVQLEQMHLLTQYHRGFLHYRIGNPEFIAQNEDWNEPLSEYRSPTPNKWFREAHPFKLDRNPQDIDDESDSGNRSDVTVDLNERPEFGIQVSRVKHLNLTPRPGTDGIMELLAKVRLTAYHTDGMSNVNMLTSGQKAGRIVMAHEGPVTCFTNSVRSDFKVASFQFGRQLANFTQVELSADCILIARVYVEEDRGTPLPISNEDRSEGSVLSNETQREEFLIGWTAIPLVLPRTKAKKNPSYLTDNLKLLRINKGIHDLYLYDAPALPPAMIFFDKKFRVVGQTPVGKAKLKLRIFHTKPYYDSATSSEENSEPDSAVSKDLASPNKKIWIPVKRKITESAPYHYDDGIDFYIDSGRFFPDITTAVKIEGKIVDRQMTEKGPNISSCSRLDSDIYNPVFKERVEIRDPTLTPSATLLLTIKTFDRETKNLVLLGYSAINLFMETGTFKCPQYDNLGVLITLNDGGHQLPIYRYGPNPDTVAFGVDWFKKNKVPIIPAASLLIRIFKPPKNKSGRPLNIEDVPTNHQQRLGVMLEAPDYDTQYYYSMDSSPQHSGEDRIMQAHSYRPPILLSRLLQSRWADPLRERVSSSEMLSQNQIYKLFEPFTLHTFNDNYIAQYHPLEGFKIAIDGALNIPWSGITVGYLILYPPGAIYKEKPYLIYDRPYFITSLDLNSTISCPIWTQGWKTYKRRKFNENLVAILHLHEMKINVLKNDFKFTLENEAWIPLQIFDGPFCITKSFQMPLIRGSPQFSDFECLKSMSVKTFLDENVFSKKVELLSNASVIVRQCDSRREREISITAENELLTLDQSYIPEVKIEQYQKVHTSSRKKDFTLLIPNGFTNDSFLELLRIKFRSLIYKLYETGGLQRL